MIQKKYTPIEVRTPKEESEFFDFAVRLYENENNWVRPLDIEVKKAFDPKRNKLLKNGKSIRWILQDKNKNTVARIAAFYNNDLALTNDQPTGGCGFFECINDQKAASTMFDLARNWLEQEGMEAMDGPINFGIRDEFWGCLVEGFTEPVYNMPYNFEYYASLFENYGFQNYFNQHTYHRLLNGVHLHPVIKRGGERILKNPDYEIKQIKKADPKFGDDFRTIYNKAWAKFSGLKPITKKETQALLKAMETILDERLVYYGYYKGEPIAFFIMMPDVGQLTKQFDGKMSIWDKLKLYYHLKRKTGIDRVIGRIFGVVPEHQAKGVEGALVLAFEQEVNKPSFPYKSLELNWIGDFNPVMMKVCEFIGGKIYKTHTTYRYLFDRNKEFKRAPKVNI